MPGRYGGENHGERFSAGFNLFLLPSSIHEFLVLPDDGEHPQEYLEQMVAAVNREAVQPEEVLSDHVYYYDAGLNSLTVAGASPGKHRTAVGVEK